MACLDTTVFLDLRGRSGRRLQEAAAAKLRALQAAGERSCTTRLNAAKMFVGVHLADDSRAEELAVLRSLERIRIFEFDDQAALQFGRIKAALQKQGRLIGDMDALIASIALVNRQSILTRNPRHFGRIPGLSVLTYSVE